MRPQRGRLDDPDLAPLRSDRLGTLAADVRRDGEADPLRDEGEELARLVVEAGVETVGIRCLGQTHGFWRHPQFTASEPLVRRWPAGSTSTSSDARGSAGSEDFRPCAFTWAPTMPDSS